MQKIENYINGKLVSPLNNQYLDNFNPAIGEIYSLIPDSNEKDINQAVKAADEIFLEWSTTPAIERSKILMKISELIERDLDKLGLAESVDNGKPVSLARTIDIPRASSNFRFFATAIMHFSSESHIMEDKAINYTIRNPLGVVGCISPWNLPLYLFTWKIAPAIASGNTVVAKPSEITPMTAYLLSSICIEAGLPPGVLNIVHGLGSKVGSAISSHPHIKAISFTGGTVTGATIAETAAPKFKKLLLELGGKNPTIIFADCNYEYMLNTTVRSSFSNQGEICLCGSRIFVEEPLYDQFKEDFVEKTKALKVGDPQDANTHRFS
jgi:aminomuconate-semialdehyde/2-hydroxymuconate-6-semialdehyde dehydrogenase